MLTCDAFGVLPPIARLTPAQAMYHFLSGFTSKVAGTEKGVTEPEPTFSTCFGAPFMPRRPEVYGNLLRDKIAQATARPAGWSTPAGPAAPTARASGCRSGPRAALLTAALDGSLARGRVPQGSEFRLRGSGESPGVDEFLLDPRRTWSDPEAYDRQARKLVAHVRRELRPVRDLTSTTT